MRKGTVLVTGTSGKLGGAVARALMDGHDVRQLDIREAVGVAQPKAGPVFVGSTVDPDVVAEAMEGVDTVVHCAAIPGTRKPYPELLELNVIGTFNMLEEAGRRREVERFVFISSLMWHGVTERPPELHRPFYLPIDENHPSSALDYYGCTKVECELWCEKYALRFGKPIVVLRPPRILTPEQQADFHAQTPATYPRLYDYIATTDLIEAIKRAMDYHPKNGCDQFLVHAADQYSTMPTLELAERFFPGVPLDRGKLGACGGFGAFVDCSHAADKLGWTPEYRCKRE